MYCTYIPRSVYISPGLSVYVLYIPRSVYISPGLAVCVLYIPQSALMCRYRYISIFKVFFLQLAYLTLLSIYISGNMNLYIYVCIKIVSMFPVTVFNPLATNAIFATKFAETCTDC
jgi:hypothetical protein